MRPTLRDVALLVLLGGLWGLTPTMAKLAMAEGVKPLGVTVVTATVSALALLAIAAARGQAPPVTRAHLRHYLAGGALGLALANLFAFTGLTRAPAGFFAIVAPLSPIATIALFALFRLERATARRVAGTLLGMGGVALAMAPGAALPDPAVLPWAAVMLLTPLCYAAGNLASVKLAVRGTPPLAQAAGTMAGAVVTAFAIAVPLGHAAIPPGSAALLLLVQGSINAGAYLLYFHLLSRAGGVFTSQCAYLTTLAGLLYGNLVFGEEPGWLTLPAAALIFAGVALVTLAPRREG